MARHALSLKAYLAYARGHGASDFADLPVRPDGPVILAHAGSPDQGRAIASLCARLRTQRPEITVYLSGETRARSGMDTIPLPNEKPVECDAFAAALRPDIVLWTSQHLNPALLLAFKTIGSELVALDAEDKAWTSSAPRWLPDPAPATLAMFDTIYATHDAAARRLFRLGISRETVHASGALQDSILPLEYPSGLHEEMAAQLAGRPVWLAAHLRAAEITEILSAHRHASRLAHRLMLIIVPENRSDAAAILQAARASKMRLCDWENGEMPDDNTQLLVAEDPSELGLWYRLAPLVFLGGSLSPGFGGHNPFEAAALGAAILYGPNVGRHLAAYSRLVTAGAARIVRDTDSLATAVSHLVAPDQAAQMAHAGWEVVSAGAALVDDVIENVCARLDERAAT